MKKCMLLFGAVAILLAACSNEPGNSGAKDKIEGANDDATISLREYDDEASTYTVTAKNLTLEGANMPNTTIVVGKEIGDADFTLKNCVFKSLEVKGGGSNSIHIEGGKIITVSAKKENVRIVLEKGAAVSALNVEVNCTLDADDNKENVVDSITISKEVKEFKIGSESSDKSIAIAITTIKFDMADGAEGSSDFKLIVKNPEIVEQTKFVDAKGDPIEIKSESDSSAEENLDNDGYEKLPLKEQEKGLRFPADSDGWSDGVTIKPIDDGEAFLIENANPVSENIWAYLAVLNMPYEGEPGKSYSVKFDLKADANCYVNVAVEDRSVSFNKPSVWCNLSTEWNSFELHTGILYESWSEFTTLTIAMGNASKVEIKNLKVKEEENKCLPTHVYHSKKKFAGGIQVTSHEDYVEFTSNERGSNNRYEPADAEDKDAFSGVDILFGVMEAGKLYKVTFDVTPDAGGGFMQVWGHAADDSYETAGNAQLSFVKGQKKTVTLYIPCYALPYTVIDKDGHEVGRGTREKTVGNIWFSCGDNKTHTIKVENIKYDVVEDVETIKKENDYNFYAGGTVTDNAATGEEKCEWSGYRNLDSNNADDDIILMPGYGIYFDYILCDSDLWDGTKSTITGFRYGGSDSVVQTQNKDGNNCLYYENKASYPVALLFGHDEQWRVTIKAENATERLKAVEQERAWYYFEFDPSEPLWTNFEKGRSNIVFTISYNDGENNSYGFYFSDTSDVVYKDGWEYRFNEKGEWNHYDTSDSKREDKPEYKPTDGKLRIYFYSDTSKLGSDSSSSLIPTLKTKVPYMYGWDCSDEKDMHTGGWPMTKA